MCNSRVYLLVIKWNGFPSTSGQVLRLPCLKATSVEEERSQAQKQKLRWQRSATAYPLWLLWMCFLEFAVEAFSKPPACGKDVLQPKTLTIQWHASESCRRGVYSCNSWSLPQLQHLGAIGEDKLWYYCNGQKKLFCRKLNGKKGKTGKAINSVTGVFEPFPKEP